MKNLYLVLVFVCLYGFVEPIGNAASSYPVASYHPRIIINRDLNLAALKARAFGSMNADYQSLVKLFNPAGNLCGLSENYTMSNIYGIGYLYQMSGNVAYADYLIDGFLLRCDLGTALESDANPAFQLEAAAVAFDWVYDRIVARDQITPGLKQSIITRLKAGPRSSSSRTAMPRRIRPPAIWKSETVMPSARNIILPRKMNPMETARLVTSPRVPSS